jgi:hypothetical protein
MMLAIFSSEGCPLCRRVAPAVAHVAADPLLAVRIFDETAGAAIEGLPRGRYRAWTETADRRVVVSLLRRTGASPDGLLQLHECAHQR